MFQVAIAMCVTCQWLPSMSAAAMFQVAITIHWLGRRVSGGDCPQLDFSAFTALVGEQKSGRVPPTPVNNLRTDHSPGDHSPGDHNTSDHNTGDHNTSDHSPGDSSSGDHNTGDHNTSDHSPGDHSPGDPSSVDHNTGDHNTGDHSPGDHNTGDHNTGAQSPDDAAGLRPQHCRQESGDSVDRSSAYGSGLSSSDGVGVGAGEAGSVHHSRDDSYESFISDDLSDMPTRDGRAGEGHPPRDSGADHPPGWRDGRAREGHPVRDSGADHPPGWRDGHAPGWRGLRGAASMESLSSQRSDDGGAGRKDNYVPFGRSERRASTAAPQQFIQAEGGARMSEEARSTIEVMQHQKKMTNVTVQQLEADDWQSVSDAATGGGEGRQGAARWTTRWLDG